MCPEDQVPGTLHLGISSCTTEVAPEPRPSSDPNDPLNWPMWRKNLNFALVSYYALLVFAVITVGPVTWAPMNRELNFGFAIINDSWAASCGALAIGVAFILPLAIKFGRRPIYIGSTLVQCGLSIWYARTITVADLMLTNVLSNFVGALAEILVQMTIADLFFVHQRGRYSTAYFLILTVGTSLPAIPGGYICSSQGWRWVWWWMAILFGIGFVAMMLLYEETMWSRSNERPSRRDHDTQQASPASMSPMTSDCSLESPRKSQIPAASSDGSDGREFVIPKETDLTASKRSLQVSTTASPSSEVSWNKVSNHFWGPFQTLFTFPAVLVVGLEYGFLTSTATVTLSTAATVLPQKPYNFTPEDIGLMNLATFMGVSLSSLVYWTYADRSILFFARRNNGIYEPEMRLWLPMLYIPLIPAGLILFGVGLDKGFPWVVPALGLGLLGFGSVPISISALTYLTDSYTEMTGVAFVGVTFMRNLIAMISIFVQTPCIEKVGLTWFYVTFSIIVTTVLMGNLVLIFWGKKFRILTSTRYRSIAKGMQR